MNGTPRFVACGVLLVSACWGQRGGDRWEEGTKFVI